MTLRVIGAGVGRTGTTSLKLALEKLGFNKCYHMEELLEHQDHVPLWLQAAEGQPVDWDALFDGYQSAVDLPIYPFYAELMEHYPQAKVILTRRDPQEWYESAAQTIFRLPSSPTMKILGVISFFDRRLKSLVQIAPVARKVGIDYFFHNDLSPENAIRVFKRHNDEVRMNVPRERLLVYDVAQGWEPLCEFLEVPVPHAPFPHKNTRDDFAARTT